MKKAKYVHRLLSLFLCLCVLLTLFCSCKKSSSTIVRLPLSTIPVCYDPQIATGADTESILNNCFEGLVRIDSNGNIVPGVAKSWTVSPDGLVYTFTLNSKAKWHLPKKLESILGEDYEKTFDTRVTANDFVFALERALDKNTNAPKAYLVSCIEGVRTKGDYTLEITLSKPNVVFMTTLASPICMPCNEEFFNATAGRYGLEANLLMCNGPYYIGTIDEATGVSLYANSSYEGEYTPLCSTAKFLLAKSFAATSEDDKNSDEQIIIPDTTTLLLAEDSGYDLATVSKAELDKLDSSFEITKYKNIVKTFCFNVSHESMANKNIRMALAHSTDITKIVSSEDMAEGIVPSSCVLTTGASYRAGVNVLSSSEYNLEKASSYLSADTGKTEAVLVCLKEDETAVKQIVQDWQKTFGVTLSITLTTFETQAELDAALNAGTYDIAYTAITSSEFLASEFFNKFISDSGENIIRLNDSTYDALVADSFDSPTEEELASTSKKCESYLLDNALFIPVVSADGYLAKDSTAKDIFVRPSGSIYALYK